MNALHSSDEQIVDYVMGSLVGDEAQQLEAHAASCAACSEKLQAEAMLEEQLFALGQSAKNVVPRETPVQWRPTAAAALRDLVDEPVPVPAPAAVATAPTPVNEVEWHYPTAKKKQSAPRWPWLVLAASVATFALAVGLVIGMQQTKQQPVLVAAASPPVATPPVAIAPQAQVEATPVAPSGALALAAVPPREPTPAPRGRGKGKSKDKELLAAAEPKKEDAGKKDGFDDLLAGKKALAPAVPIREKLSRDDVLGTVNANKASIVKCANAYANTGGTLPAKIVGKWTIKASGFVENVEMASPELKGTSVDACVVAAIKKWRFPEFRSGEVPVTFPFAISQ